MCLCQRNILVDSHGRAFVTDVGISMMLDDIAESEPSRRGAIRWTAPELADHTEDRLPTSKSDVWSFGCNMIHVTIHLVLGYPHQYLTTILGAFREGALVGNSARFFCSRPFTSSPCTTSPTRN